MNFLLATSRREFWKSFNYTRDAQRISNFFFTTALKARPVTAMGATHGIEVTKDFPLPPTITIKKQTSNA